MALPRSPMVVARLPWDLRRASRGRFPLALRRNMKERYGSISSTVTLDTCPGPGSDDVRLRRIVDELPRDWW